MSIAFLLFALLHAPAAVQDESKVVTLNGRTDRLPQYFVYQRVFAVIVEREATPAGARALRREVGLTDQEMALTRASIDQFFAEDREFIEGLDVELEKLHRTSFDAFLARRRSIDLERRALVLKHADAVADALAGDGRNRWFAWVDDFSKTLTVTLPESALAFFRLPR